MHLLVIKERSRREKDPAIRAPLIHDNIRCMTVPIRNKDLGRKTKHATLVQHEMFM